MNRMRFRFSLLYVSLVSLFWGDVLAESGGRREWDFSRQEDSQQWSRRNFRSAAPGEKGLELVSGNDCQLLTAGKFSASDFIGFEVTLSADRDCAGQIFFALPKTGYTAGNSVMFRIQASSEPRKYRVLCAAKPGWSGTVTGLRFDPAVESGVRITLRSLRLLRPEWTFDSDAACAGWSLRDLEQRSFQNGALSFRSGRDSSIISPDLSIPADRFAFCEIVMRVDRQAHGELFFSEPGKRFVQKQSLSFQVAPSSEFRTYRIDCRRSPYWKGVISRLRFDPVSFAGVKVQIRSLRLLSGAGEELLSAEYVGMPAAEQQDDTAFRQPTLTGVHQKPASGRVKQHNQLGNDAPIRTLEPRLSKEIAEGNIFGVALNGGEFFFVTPEIKGAQWSAYWLNDGEKLAGDCNTVFSSGMHYTPEAQEWCGIALPETKKIRRVVLRLRNRGSLCGFPMDFQILRSSDGTSWETVADVKNCRTLPSAEADAFVFEMEPKPLKQLKIVATRLRAEGEGRHYFQLREIELYGEDGVNYAAAEKGGIASAGNPLGGKQFDYKEFFDGIFTCGAQWLTVSNQHFLSPGKTGVPPVRRAELANAEYLRKNGVRLLYRFFAFPSFREFQAAPGEVTRRYVEALSPVVEILRGNVSIWALANEQNFFGDRISPAEYPAYLNYYVTLVGAAADRIRQLDPETPIEIETALFDYEWTEAVLKAGLAAKIDRIGVHVYKELRGRDTFPEAAGAVSRNGKRFYAGPWRDYAEQIAFLRNRIGQYNPRLRITVSETGVNTGDNPEGGSHYVSETSQAKFLARLYTFHVLHGIGPTCWWSLEPVKTGQFQWGLIAPDGRRKEAWMALRNVAAVLDNSCQPASDLFCRPVRKIDDLLCRVLRTGRDGEYLIPYWRIVKMRDGNTGFPADFQLSGQEILHIEAIDTLSGTVHPVRFEQKDSSFCLNNMVVRDYPVILRVQVRKDRQKAGIPPAAPSAVD